MFKVSLPGSKSWINRFLIMATFAHGSSTCVANNQCDDVRHMMGALKQFGHHIDTHGEKIVVTPGEWKKTTVFAGEAGTVCRFLTPICAWLGETTLEMTPQLAARPMDEGLASVRSAGGEVVKEPTAFKFGKAMATDEFVASPHATSQFLSGFMMLAAGIQGSVVLQSEIPAGAYVELTSKIIELFGVKCRRDESGFQYSGKAMGVEARAEADLSGASALLAALGLLRKDALLEGWDAATVQAEGLLPEILVRAGVKLDLCDEGLNYHAGSFGGMELDCKDVPDAVPALVALASTGDRPSFFTNYDYLATKESNRTERIMEMGRAAGMQLDFDGHTLKVHPSTLHACELDGGDDHRMAMYALLLKLRNPEIKVEGLHSLSKSFPNFNEKLEIIKAS